MVASAWRSLLDHVAGDAAPLVDEHLEAAFLLRGESTGLSAVEVAVEGRVARDHGALEGRDRPRDLDHGDALAALVEDGLEGLGVLGIRAHDVQDGLVVRQAHLHGIDEGMQGLILEVGGAPVPELRREVRRVDHRGRVPRARQLLDSLGHLQGRVRERLLLFVAGRAAHVARGAEAFVVVELVAEGDLLRRLGIVGGHGHRRQAQRGPIRSRGRSCESGAEQV